MHPRPSRLRARRLLPVLMVLAMAGTAVVARQWGQLYRMEDYPRNPRLLPERLQGGELAVAPESATAGEYGTWTLSCRLGRAIKTGGGLRVQFPDAFHAGIRNSAFRLQGTQPGEPGYVSARCSSPGVEVQAIVEQQGENYLGKGTLASNLSNRQGYYTHVVRVFVVKGSVAPDATLSVIYGDTTRGSRGLRAGIHACENKPLFVAVDTEGTGEFRLHASPPRLSLKPAPAVELAATLPSSGVVGEPALLRLAALDGNANPATGLGGEVALRVLEGEARVPATVLIEPGRGWAEARIVPGRAGWLRIEAREAGRALEAASNPMQVSREQPAERIYWGDLHSHTAYSAGDGVGDGEEAYLYARRFSALDFYAMTDHSYDKGPGPLVRGLTVDQWAEYTALADRFHDPGAFVTLHAYEASFGSPFGHHNVFFRGKPGALVSPESATLPELWKQLAAGEVLTIPHHTMKMPGPIDWTGVEDAARRRNFEIYSGHGLSEEYDPWHPLAFEQSLFTNPSQTLKNGLSAQDAWARGFELSTIASSDDHRAHPGQPHYGLAAVRARALTREGIFDGLHDRRTYGTTGARILLDFAVGDVAMGGRGRIAGEARVRVQAKGTDVIDLVEVLRHVKGTPGFQVIRQERPAREQVELEFADRPPAGEVVYYARLRQRHLVRERLAMAWSSPVWVTAAP